MSLVETPKKKVAKRGRTSVKEHANDYCRICRCKFKLARCSSINLSKEVQGKTSTYALLIFVVKVK